MRTVECGGLLGSCNKLEGRGCKNKKFNEKLDAPFILTHRKQNDTSAGSVPALLCVALLSRPNRDPTTRSSTLFVRGEGMGGFCSLQWL